MAQLSFSQAFLRAMVYFLEHLEKKKGQVVSPEFPEGFFPPEIDAKKVQETLLNSLRESGISTLEDLWEQKEEVLDLMSGVSPKGEIISPKVQKIIPLPGKPKPILDPKQILQNLDQAIKTLQAKEEKAVYKGKPLTATEKEVQETVLAIQEKAQEELEETVKKPAYAEKIKEPVEEIAHRVGQAIRNKLDTLVEVNDAIRWAQIALQESGLPQDEAYAIAKKIIGPEIKPKSIRHQTSLYNEYHKTHQELSNIVKETLDQTGLPADKINLVIGAIDEGIDPILTKGFSQQDPDSAQKIIKNTILKALTNKVSSESAEFIATSLSSQAPIIQSLARISDRWDVPEGVKNIAFERTTPPGVKELVINTKKFIIQYGLGGIYLKREEPKVEELARTAAERIERRARAAAFPIENLPEVVKEAIFASLNGEKYGTTLVQKVRKGIKGVKDKEFPQALLQSVKEKIPPRLCPWEKAEIERLIEDGILSQEAAENYQNALTKPLRVPDPWLSPSTSPGIVSKATASFLVSLEKERREELSERQKFLLEQAEKTAPKNRIARSLFNRFFRFFAKGKTPLETLKDISSLGPSKFSFLSQFRKEIFNRFLNAFLDKVGWLKLDRSTGNLYFRFGKYALKRGFSRFLSFPKEFPQNISNFIRSTTNQLITRGGKFLQNLAPLIKNLGAAALKAMSGFLAGALNALLGIGSAAAGFLSSAFAAITGATAGPVLVVIAAALLVIFILTLFFNINLQSAFVDFSKEGLIPKRPEPPYGTCKLTDSAMLGQSLISIFEDASGAFKVPPAVIAGVAAIEGRHMWGYNDTEISAFSLPQAQDPYNCSPNMCGARGPMQFLTGEGVNPNKCPQAIGINIWSVYKNAVNEATGENRTPHVCNIKDSIFAAAKKLKKDSRTTQENDCEWTKEQVYNSARGYYGNCEYKIERGLITITGNYCERVWQYYVNHS